MEFLVLQRCGTCLTMSESQESGDVSQEQVSQSTRVQYRIVFIEPVLQEHTQSLLRNIQELHTGSLFSDLRIICDDGVVPSYWYEIVFLVQDFNDKSYSVVFGSCSALVSHCLLSLSDSDPATLILPGVSTADLTSFLSCLYTFKVSEHSYMALCSTVNRFC